MEEGMNGSALSRRGFTSLLALSALSISVLAGVGCGPPGIVVRQATPNPLVGKVDFVVEPVAYANLMVGDKTEAAYLGDKKPEQQQSFEADKAETGKNLIEMLTAETGRKGIKVVLSTGTPGMYNIRPAITFFEPGNFNGFVNFPTVLKATMQVIDAQGQIIGSPVVAPGVILYPCRPLGLCAGLTDARYTTTTEVYPDSPRATPEQCNAAQAAAVCAAIDYLLTHPISA
jgi:hypothetical protein